MKSVAVTLLAFLLAFAALRHAWPHGILLYQGIALGGVGAIAQVLALRRRGAGWRGAAKDGWISFLMIYAFVFTVPTTVDRAYSVHMLERLADAPEGLDRAAIVQLYADDFARQGGVDRRLAEQLATGTLQARDGRYRLTPLGRALVHSFALTRDAFACGQAVR